MNSAHNTGYFDFNLGFWHLLKKSIMFHKDSTPLKEKVLAAKRILTPIIQDLMTDALVQTEFEKFCKFHKNKQIEEKNINILFNKVKSDDNGHLDRTNSDNEWATKILKEINRDLDQPFDKVLGRVENHKRPLEEAPLNETLLEKLVSVYQHLGEIIEHLKSRCAINKEKATLNESPNGDISLNMSEFPTHSKKNRESIGKSAEKNSDSGISKCKCKEFVPKILDDRIDQEVVNYQCSYKDIYVLASYPQTYDNQVMRGTTCSSDSIVCLRHSEENDKHVASKEYKSTGTSISEHQFLEHTQNQTGNKDIVLKCLESLDKVRTYLESLRNDEETCESPLFCLDNCKHEDCIKIQCECMVLKQEEEIGNNHKTGNSCFVDGSSDIKIHSDKKKRGNDTHQQTEIKFDKTSSRQSHKDSRIPKLIPKKRANSTGNRSSSDMKIILKSGGDSQQKVMNLVIFNPDDPCKSIIKMKDLENVAATNSNAGVSKIMKTSETKIRINFLCQKIYGVKKETRRNPFWPGSLNLLSTLSDVSELRTHNIEIVFTIIILIEDFSCWDVERKPTIILIFFNCECCCFKKGWKKHSSVDMSVLIYHYLFSETYNCNKSTSALTSARDLQKLLSIPIRKSFYCTNLLLYNYSEKYVIGYMKNLFRFMSFMKGNLIPEMDEYYQGTKNEQACFIKNNSTFLNHEVINEDSRNQNYHAYFFSCSVERREEQELDSYDDDNKQWEGSPTYPIWRIKKSKYYNLPSKKVGDGKMTEKTSKAGKSASASRSNTQMSSGSCADKFLEHKLSDNHTMWRRSEMKRRVSFRDDVDFLKRGGCHREGLENDFINGKGKNKESLSTDSLDIYKSDDELADLLMTDSLMMFGSSIPERAMKPKHSRNKELWENLELTNSAEDILSKLTRSFDYRDSERCPTFGTMSGGTTSNFHDDESNSLGTGMSLQENLKGKMKADDVNNFGSTLLNSKCSSEKNKYNKREKHIGDMIQTEKNHAEQAKPEKNEITSKTPAAAEIVRYYDNKAKPIEHLYDASGHKIETVGGDITSEMFDKNGNLRTNLYTKKGKRINAVYSSKGKLLQAVSDPKLKYDHPRTDKIRDHSLSPPLLEDNEKVSSTGQNKMITDDGCCSKNYYNAGDYLSSGQSDHKKKSSTVIATKEHERTLENENKPNEKKLDSKDPETSAMLNGVETRKSEVSISWLNELLSASKVFARKKRDSIFRRKSKLKLANLKVLYDENGNIITHVYDCRGNLLAESPSGNAETLIPFLFDSSGTFIEGRFVSEKNELKFVSDKNKNIIKNISLTTLNKLLNIVGEEMKENSLLRNERERAKIDDDYNEASARHNSSESNPAVVKEIQVDTRKPEKYIRQLFDEKGNLLTAIYDSRGKQLEISNPEYASNLSPYLFESEGKHSNQYYDSDGHKLRAIYDEDGNVLKNMIISLTHLNKKKQVDKRPNNTEMFTKIKKYSKIVDKIISLDAGFDDVEENIHEMSPDNNANQSLKKHSDLQKFKSERDKSDDFKSQKVPTTSKHKVSRQNTSSYKSEDKHLKASPSISVKRSENHKMNPHRELDVRIGKSMQKFYDSNGKEIRGVYDCNGRAMMKIKSGEADKLAPFFFDRNGFLSKNIYDKYGRQIKKIYDYKGKDIKRISVKTLSSEHTIEKIRKKEEKRRHDGIYDGNGKLVREICDRKGHLLVITKSLNMEDITPFIFHENGNRRRVYDQSGYEIGPLYDHKGNLLKYLPSVKQVKQKEVQQSDIFSKSGRKLNNLYDSEGTIIIALYNDDAKLICSIEKGQNNVKILSKFLFDEHGRFLKGKYLDFRGSRIKRVYDSNDNIIHSIIPTYPRKSHHERVDHVRESNKRVKKNTSSLSRMNRESRNISKQWQNVRSSRNRNKPTESLANVTSMSDVELKNRGPKLKRPISAYFLNEPQPQYESPVRNSHSSSSMLIKPRKFHDMNGRLLNGTYISKSTLLSYYSSGNLRAIAAGNSISERPNLEDMPRKPIFDIRGNLEKYRSCDIKKYSETDVDEKHDYKVNGTTQRHRSKSRKNSFYDSLVGSERYNRHRHSKERHSVDHSDRKTKNDYERNKCKSINHRKRLPFFTSLKDKILTVVFENLNLNSKYNTTSERNVEKRLNTTHLLENNDEYIDKVISKYGFHKIVDKTKNKINYQSDRNRKRRNYKDRERYSEKFDSIASLGCQFYSTPGNLVSKNISRITIDRSEPLDLKKCDECRSISTLYTNKKLVKKIHENEKPAKVDSDLIYLVSKQSLPGELDTPIEPVFTQMNSTLEATNYYCPDEITIRTYSRKRTSECVCQQCQSTGRNKNFIGQLGREFMTRLSGLTLPFDKFFTRNLLGQGSFKEEKDGTDSLEALINKAFANKNEPKIGRPQKKSCSSSCVAPPIDDTLPISRKMIQETLMACIHLNNKTDVIGKVSNMMLQHFTASIMQEIKHTFFEKLSALQYRKPTSEDSSVFDSEIVREDICVGTESKFDDSLIGKHNIIQTEKRQIIDNSMPYKNKAISAVRSSEYLEEMPSQCQCAHRRTFICKLPNTEPFVFSMKRTTASNNFNEKDSSKQI